MANKQTIEIIARGLWRQGDHILLCRNRKHGHVFLPGGHVEFGEPAAAALKRELQEELGLDLNVGPLLGVCEASFWQKPAQKSRKSGESRGHHEINLLFEVRLPRNGRGQAAADPLSQEDHIEFVWVKIQNLRGRRPSVRLLPHAIVPLITTSSRQRVPFTTEIEH